MNVSLTFSTWVAALLTLAVLSFLWRDNPIYKFAEFLFVGCSAGYFAAQYWHTNIKDDLLKKLFPGAWGLEAQPEWHLLVGVAIGITILMRLVPAAAWLSRIGIAFIVGFNAGIQIFSQMSGFVLSQVEATLRPFYSGGSVGAVLRELVVTVSALTGLTYFYFSKEQRGWFGGVTRLGIWFLMISFGAAYGNTVMTRISIMAGRVVFLLGDWLGFKIM
jgi:hypothetical protein